MTESDEKSRPRESRHVFWTLAFLGLVALTVAAASITDRMHQDPPGAFPAGFPAISGLTLLEPDRFDTYVVVHDTKAPDAKDPSKPRMALLQIVPGTSPRYQPLALRDEGLEGGPLSDIEAIASIPMRPFEFLLLESGGGKRPRRLAHVEITRGVDRVAKVLGHADLAQQTPDFADCESLLCWRTGDELRVLIADRGEGDFPALQAKTFLAKLTLTRVDDHSKVEVVPEPSPGTIDVRLPDHVQEAPIPDLKPWRACSDLFVDSDERIWGACARDLKLDDGPFRSMVYLAGKRVDGRLVFEPASIRYSLDGIKVEAIGPCKTGPASLCVATDDENYGGVWRPLPPKP